MNSQTNNENCTACDLNCKATFYCSECHKKFNCCNYQIGWPEETTEKPICKMCFTELYLDPDWQLWVPIMKKWMKTI